LDSLGDNFREVGVIWSFVEFGTMQVWAAASSSSLPVAEGTLRFKKPFADDGIAGRIRRLSEGARDGD
jgi:hypothetical protein